MERTLKVAAIVLVGLCFVPVGAHLLEMPGKLAMDRDTYLATQHIYDGWAWFGVVEIAALVCLVALAWALRRERTTMWYAAVSAGLIVAQLIVFFALTYPANLDTSNWTTLPDGWEAVRTRWEYGHAIGGVLTFFALIAVALAATLPRQRQ